MVDYRKSIICLANSRKTSGRCIAGVELVDGQAGAWIRPVSKRDSAELSEADRNYSDGSGPKVFDIITVRFISQKQHAFQTENHLINDGYYFTLSGQATFDQVSALVDRTGRPLWYNFSSSYNGLRDRIDIQNIRPEEGSLRLIEVNDLEITVGVEGAAFNNAKRKVRGRFSLNGVQHYLSITDPVIEKSALEQNDGTHPVGYAILCLSLGEIYQDYTYKLIASVITR